MIQSALLPSPLGKIYVEANERGLRRLSLAKEDTQGPASREIPQVLEACAEQLDAYFKGDLEEFQLRLDLSGNTAFHEEVWKMVRLIPYGRTRTYTDIADAIDHPHASRAVGHAIGQNPLPIIIPCHRVIGKNGSLTGYLYGLEAKRFLLGLESPGKYMKQGDLVDTLEHLAV